MNEWQAIQRFCRHTSLSRLLSIRPLLLPYLLFSIFSTFTPCSAQSNNMEIFIDDTAIVLPQPILHQGGIISLPLEAVARHLGSPITIDSNTSTISIVRSRDQSIFSYNTITGQSAVNDVPMGILPNPIPINIASPSDIYLPTDILAVALNVSIEPRGNTLNIYRDSGSRSSPFILRPSGGWKDIGLDFLRYDIQEQTFKPRLFPAPQIPGQGTTPPSPTITGSNPRIYNRTVLFGGGSHWGAYEFEGASILVGGTPPKVGRRFPKLTYSSAYLNAINVTNGWQFYGGTTYLKNYHNDRFFNGYPVLGLSSVLPLKKNWTVSQFLGQGYTNAISTGGGTTRFAYHRPTTITEVAWSPNRHFTTSLAAIAFKDIYPIKLKTKENGAYLQSYTTWKTRNTDISVLGAFGASKLTDTLKGGSYVVDIRARRKITKYTTIFGAFDRYSPNFVNPQLTSNYFNRQDLLLGTSINWRNRLGYGVSYSDNLTNLNFFRPDRSQTVSMSATMAPFRVGPQINLTGLKTNAVRGATRFQDSLTIPDNQSHFTLASIGVNQALLGTQFAANVISTKQTNETGKTGRITTINLNATRDLPRIGRLTVSSIFNTQSIFQITALLTTRPFYRNTVLTFGPGYSANGISDTFTFIAALGTKPPFLGNFSSNVSSLLPQTTTSGRLEKLIWTSKNHRAPSGLVPAQDQIPQGSVSGRVVMATEFPVLNQKNAIKMSNIGILLDDHVEKPVKTDKNGEYHFTNIPPGMHKISLDLTSIPADLAITSPEYFYTRISAYKDTIVNFSLAKMGQLEGSLTAGADITKENLENTRVYIVERKQLETTSNIDGSYRITDIPAGSYTVRVDPTYLGSVEIIPAEQKIEVNAEKTTILVPFIINKKVELKTF